MIRRLALALILCLLYTTPALATRQAISGWCEDGGAQVTVPGTPGSGTQRFQRSYQSCTVTVYLANTLTLATLYSDAEGTAKANPFTSSALGRWSFFADGGTYDVRFSGGGISSPFTISDFRIPNDVFNVTDYGARCDGTTNDYNAINYARSVATAQANGGTVLIPSNVPGTCLINSSITIDADVTLAFEGGGRIAMASGTTATIVGTVDAGPSQIFTGSGNVVFANATPIFARQERVLVEWWGAKADYDAANVAGTTDNGPPICKALNSGAVRIEHAGGIYGVRTQCTITAANFTWDGGARTNSTLAATVTTFSVAGSPNAMFINNNNALNAVITRHRFTNFGVAYTGYAFWAEEDAGSVSEAMFTTTFRDNFVFMGPTSAGFLYGDLVDSFYTNNNHEFTQTVLEMTGPYFTGNNIAGNSIQSGSGFFVYSTGTSDSNNISGTLVNVHKANPLFHFEGASNLTINNTNLTFVGTTATTTGAIGEFVNCVRCLFTDFIAWNNSGYLKGFDIVSSDIKITDGEIYDADGSGTSVITISGSNNNIDISGVKFISSGIAEINISSTGTTSGQIRIHDNYSFENEFYFVLNSTSHAADVTIRDNEIRNAGAANAVPFVAVETSGILDITGNTAFFSAGTSSSIGFLTATGTGTGALYNNIFHGISGTWPLLTPATTQAVKVGVNVGGAAGIYFATAMPTSNSWTIGDLVIKSNPSGTPETFGWHRLTTGSGNVLDTDWRVIGGYQTPLTITTSALAGAGAPANGTMIYCTDCAINTAPCTASSTGALMVRVNGGWMCLGN